MSNTAGGSAPVAYPQVGLTGPAAGSTADLYSVSRDLVFAKQCAQAYASGRVNSEDPSVGDDVSAHALWNAGAISYRRAFVSGRGHLTVQGKRLRLDESFVALLSEEQRAAHQLVLDLANRHIAHRVGDQEGATVLAFLEPPPAEPGIAGVGTMSVHMVGPERDVAEHLAAICGVFLEVLDVEYQRRLEALLVNLRATADLDAMYAAATEPGVRPS